MEHKRYVKVYVAKAGKNFSEYDTSFAGYFPGRTISCPNCRCENGFAILSFKTSLTDREIKKYIEQMFKNGEYITQIEEIEF